MSLSSELIFHKQSKVRLGSSNKSKLNSIDSENQLSCLYKQDKESSSFYNKKECMIYINNLKRKINRFTKSIKFSYKNIKNKLSIKNNNDTFIVTYNTLKDNENTDTILSVNNNIQVNIESDIKENIESDIKENIESDIQVNIESDIKENIKIDMNTNTEAYNNLSSKDEYDDLYSTLECDYYTSKDKLYTTSGRQSESDSCSSNITMSDNSCSSLTCLEKSEEEEYQEYLNKHIKYNSPSFLTCLDKKRDEIYEYETTNESDYYSYYEDEFDFKNDFVLIYEENKSLKEELDEIDNLNRSSCPTLSQSKNIENKIQESKFYIQDKPTSILDTSPNRIDAVSSGLDMASRIHYFDSSTKDFKFCALDLEHKITDLRNKIDSLKNEQENEKIELKKIEKEIIDCNFSPCTHNLININKLQLASKKRDIEDRILILESNIVINLSDLLPLEKKYRLYENEKQINKIKNNDKIKYNNNLNSSILEKQDDTFFYDIITPCDVYLFSPLKDRNNTCRDLYVVYTFNRKYDKIVYYAKYRILLTSKVNMKRLLSADLIRIKKELLKNDLLWISY
ncbi:hypothetical protein Yalta_062 [Yalta virus]|nr:hypothetical protein Yalta_062 [Yalta virus]